MSDLALTFEEEQLILKNRAKEARKALNLGEKLKAELEKCPTLNEVLEFFHITLNSLKVKDQTRYLGLNQTTKMFEYKNYETKDSISQKVTVYYTCLGWEDKPIIQQVGNMMLTRPSHVTIQTIGDRVIEIKIEGFEYMHTTIYETFGNHAVGMFKMLQECDYKTFILTQLRKAIARDIVYLEEDIENREKVLTEFKGIITRCKNFYGQQYDALKLEYLQSQRKENKQ